nr:hypothetical protein [Sinomonas mesophila]
MKWAELAIVAIATIFSAGTVVLLYGLGVRLAAVAADRRPKGALQNAVSKACFGLCGLAVVVGVYLIVPYFH